MQKSLWAMVAAALMALALLGCGNPLGSPAPSGEFTPTAPPPSDGMPTINPNGGSPNPSIMVPPPIY
jgi:hypothetical protein